jgi:hypothetical protein
VRQKNAPRVAGQEDLGREAYSPKICWIRPVAAWTM